MTPAERRELEAVKAELSGLRRRVENARGVGLSTANGAESVRTTQLGFPAELTSSWNASTGYSWKRLRLTGVTTGNPTIQPTGSGAVTPGGDTSLASGARGWMEPSPDAQGWYFTPDPRVTDPDGPGGTTTFKCRRRFPDYDADTCFLWRIPEAGRGRCSGVAATEADITGAWDADRSAWVTDLAAATAASDDTYFELFRPTDAPGEPEMRARWTTTSSGGPTVHTSPGTYVRCVDFTEADGTTNTWFEFAFAGDDLCTPGSSCGDNWFLVWVRCGPCGLTYSPCDLPAFTVPRNLCVTLNWVQGSNPAELAECAGCDVSIPVAYGTHPGVGGFGADFVGWYGVIDRPAGCYTSGAGPIEAWVSVNDIDVGSYFQVSVFALAGTGGAAPCANKDCGDYSGVTFNPFSVTIPAGTVPTAECANPPDCTHYSCATTSCVSGFEITVAEDTGYCGVSPPPPPPPPPPPGVCPCTIADGTTCTLTVTGGANAGTYTAAWSTAINQASFALVTTTATVECQISGGVQLLTCNGTGGFADCGPPVTESWTGADAGGITGATSVVFTT